MKIKELLDMKLGDILNEFCILFSPECDYFYGIGRYDDALQMWDEFDLEEEYCFDTDCLLDYCMEIDFDDNILEIDDLRHILDYLGIEKKPTEGEGVNKK